MESQTVLKTAGGKTLTGSTPVPSAKIDSFWPLLLTEDGLKLLKLYGMIDPAVKNSGKTSINCILTETGAQCRETKLKAKR